MSHAIDVDSLSVRFGDVVAVHDVSLHVDFGTISVVLGPNGAGKTTTLETLLGFRRPSTGTVRVLGRDPHRDHHAVVLSTGAMLQRGGVWQPMTPLQCLRLTASYYPEPRDVDELVETLGLRSCASTPWRRISGGEQQRTLLALALLGRPRVLVLDEPTAGVDPEGHLVVRRVIDAERHRGCAILLATHDLADAESLADAVTVIHRGRVLADGSLATLRAPRFVIESSIDLDVAELSRRTGVPFSTDGPRIYSSTSANDQTVNAVTAHVASVGASVVSLRTRATLEEIYLSLVADDAVAP